MWAVGRLVEGRQRQGGLSLLCWPFAVVCDELSTYVACTWRLSLLCGGQGTCGSLRRRHERERVARGHAPDEDTTAAGAARRK
jgi:hypothetical protein